MPNSLKVLPKYTAEGGVATDGPIIEGEEEKKSIATVLKRTCVDRNNTICTKLYRRAIYRNKNGVAKGISRFYSRSREISRKLSKNGHFCTLRFFKFFRCVHASL